MAIVIERCIASTQTGERCTNAAVAGGDTCLLHAPGASAGSGDANVAEGARTKETAGSAPPLPVVQTRQVTPEMEILAQELESLIRELRARRIRLNPDDFTPAQFAHFVNRTVGKRLPDAPAALLEDVERNLDGASFADFADPDVIRGMALLTYYSVQAQAETLSEPVLARLQRLPGYSYLGSVKRNLDGATWQDLADAETWTGLWRLASYSAQMKLYELLREYEERE